MGYLWPQMGERMAQLCDNSVHLNRRENLITCYCEMILFLIDVCYLSLAVYVIRDFLTMRYINPHLIDWLIDIFPLI